MLHSRGMKYLITLPLLIYSLVAVSQKDHDLSSIDGLIGTLMGEITIEQGEKMDTSSIRQLFRPSAQLSMLSGDQSGELESVSLDDFLELLMDPYYEEGYLEKELHKVTDEFNGIAQVFQSFYGRDSEGTEERGINSYQLAYYDNRWWIVSMLWTIESPEDPIPNKYLK